MLTSRQGTILNIIVGEYIVSGVPVPSQSVAVRRALRVSPATVRNEMAELEDGGYIVRPHISAGSVPADKGYRHYVASMPAEPALPDEQARRIEREFRMAVQDVELWADLAADLLAGIASNMAAVSPPKAATSRVRRMDLVLMQETMALLVLVLQQAKTRKRMLQLEAAATQDELTLLANKLSALYGGSDRQRLLPRDGETSSLERQVLDAARELLADEDERSLAEPAVHGLRYLLAQPEFAEGGRASALAEMLEDRKFLKDALPSLLAGEQVRVVIGDEADAPELQPCSLVLARYGAPGDVGGVVAVIGPKRMPYDRTIASVRLVSRSLTDLVQTLS